MDKMAIWCIVTTSDRCIRTAIDTISVLKNLIDQWR